MATLIALLISLLGYGTPADFQDYTEEQLQTEISILEEEAANEDDGGLGGNWDAPGVHSPNDGE